MAFLRFGCAFCHLDHMDFFMLLNVHQHIASVEGVRRFSAIAFYLPLSLILVLGLIYQQNNNNRLYSKEDSPSSSKTFITRLLSVLSLLVIDDFQNITFPGAKKIETNLFGGFLNLLKSYYCQCIDAKIKPELHVEAFLTYVKPQILPRLLNKQEK